MAAFSTESSAPLAGVIAPYKARGSTLSYGGLRYYLQGITPSLRPGEIGWCETYWVLGTVKLGAGKTLPHFGQGSGSCDGTAAVGSPIFAADGGSGPGLHFFFTAPDVTAVTLANRLRVLTRPDPGLPYGFRAAVFNLPSGTNIESVPIRPGEVNALDASGQLIPGGESNITAMTRTVSWISGQPDKTGRCSIRARLGSGLKELAGTAVRSITGDPGIIGHAFLSCVEAGFSAHHAMLDAAVLLDARRPGSPPAPIVGVHAVPGEPGFFDWPNPDGSPGGFRARGASGGGGLSDSRFGPEFPPLDGLSARRVGDAWLVVTGGTGSQQRISALHQLAVGPIDLRAPVLPLAAPTGARCWIGYRPLAGLREVLELQPPTFAAAANLRPGSPSCTVAASFYYQDWPINVLLSIGGRALEYRSMIPIAGQPSLFTVKTAVDRPPSLLRHVGTVWLLVSSGSGTKQEQSVLNQLTVSIKRP